jgi:hypothetical protein
MAYSSTAGARPIMATTSKALPLRDAVPKETGLRDVTGRFPHAFGDNGREK